MVLGQKQCGYEKDRIIELILIFYLNFVLSYFYFFIHSFWLQVRKWLSFKYLYLIQKLSKKYHWSRGQFLGESYWVNDLLTVHSN